MGASEIWGVLVSAATSATAAEVGTLDAPMIRSTLSSCAAIEVARAKRRVGTMNQIPPITDPIGRNWQQPAAALIALDDFYAVMERKTFDDLAEYSSSIPSGVYAGKMWKRQDFNDSEWLLLWYGPSPDPNMCSINIRKILLVN